MLVVFQQRDQTPGDPNGDGPLPEPIVEHNSQNRNKHVRQPKVQFIVQAIKCRRLAPTEPLRYHMDFALAAIHFSRGKSVK